MSTNSKQKLVFIVNPFSGTSSKSDFARLVEARLDSRKYDYKIAYTEYAGHAIDLAAQSKRDGIDLVVAVGGDGSVNEVAQSLLHSDTCLGILPGGSGNGLSMHLGLGRDTAAAITHLNTGRQITVDTCTVNDRFFANVAGIGFDARIAFMTKKNKKRGFLPYFLTSVRESRQFKPAELHIEIDGQKINGRYAAAVVANASMYGYHFTISPEASLQDGVMDIMLIKEAPLYRYFFESYRFLNRSLHKSQLTETYRGKNIAIQLKEVDYIHVDGEGYESETHLSFEINPLSLKVLVPRTQSHKWSL